MPIDTGAFLAGVGILVMLDLANLAITVKNARDLGVDERARQKAAEAEELALQLRSRMNNRGRWKRDDD
jgi:hypothetical protein